MSTVTTDPVLLDVDEGVARLRLNRPEASNALNGALLEGLVDAIRSLQRDPSVRVVLLTGEGKNFCGGGDVVEFASKGEALPDHLRDLTALLQIAASGLVHLSAPVITLVQGAATGGGGLGLVCASDIVLAGPRAKFMLGATRVGMAPDAGLSVTLTRLVGLRQAMRIALTNPMLDAAEARELGIVTEVVSDEAELYDAGQELARTLAAGAPLAQAATKRLLWRGIGASFEDCLPDEARTVSELSGTADSREGLAAVIERRAPVYPGD
jgi:2-(1,2-epoxy-1,2-dihydrophenyl)acetyl-CoA isomerase